MSTRPVLLKDPASRYGFRYDELVHRMHIVVDGETPEKAFQALATQGVHLRPGGGQNDRFLQQVPSCRLWVSDIQLGFHSWRETGPYRNAVAYNYTTAAHTDTQAHVQLGRLGVVRLHCDGLTQPQAQTFEVGSGAGGAYTAHQGTLATSRFYGGCDFLTSLHLRTPSVPGMVHEEPGLGLVTQYRHTYPYYTLANPDPAQGIVTSNPFGQTLKFRFSHPLTTFTDPVTNPPDYRGSTAGMSLPTLTPDTYRKGIVYWDEPALWREPPTDANGLKGGNLAGNQTPAMGVDPAAQAQLWNLCLPFSFTLCVQPMVPIYSSVYPHVK